jgi:RND family efflux transporter MFP subunit
MRDRGLGIGDRGLVLALLVVTAMIAPTCRRAPAADAGGDSESDAIPVAAQAVTSGSMRAVVRASGVIVPAEGAEFLLVAPEPARLVEVTKVVGDSVASGEVLVRFELTNSAQDVARHRAELARAQAQVENARAGQTRTRDLVARGLIPRIDLDAAGRELADAQQALDRATSMFALAEAAAARSIVRAPFAGVVAARLHNPGDLVQPAVTDPILRIVDPARVEVLASVPPVDAPRVLQGATARTGSAIEGLIVPLTVAMRSPVSAVTGMASVRLLPNGPLKLAVDTTIAVEIDAEERTNVVFIAPEWIITDGGQTVVMIAKGDRAERRPVKTGITTDAGVEITSGLTTGELLITQGHIGLEDGAAINVVVR